ncbi:MAG: GNAT family N-acetyltransferase [Frankia sp.]
MSRRVANITLDNIEDLPDPCRRCVFWELDPVARSRAEQAGGTDLEKEAWVSATLLEWGSCGKIVYVDGVPAGYVIYAPPAYVPRSVAFPTSPISPDAVLLTNAHVIEGFGGQGLGRVLVQSAAKDVLRRGIRAIEAFGDLKGDTTHCVVPADYLLAVGFKTVRPHHRWPRLRLELKNVLSWREDVEVALERLLGSMTPENALRTNPRPVVRPGLAPA